MALETIQLKTPNSLYIVGVKLKDNSLASFVSKYDNEAKTWLYEMPPETISKKINPTVLVDSEGGEWKSHEVEFHTLTNGLFSNK